MSDRLPPHAPDAERGILGCILLSPNDSLAECLRLLKPGAEAFYDLRHQSLFTLLAKMYDERTPIDLITVQNRLRDTGQLEAVGGPVYLNQLADGVPSAANLGYYLDIALEKYGLRRLIQTCQASIARAYDHQGEASEIHDAAEREILAVRAELTAGSAGTLTGKSLATAAIEHLESLAEGKAGLASGLTDLDRITGGFYPGQMIVIAGRPGAGKSAIMQNIAWHLATRARVPVGFFSLEMTGGSIATRFLTADARANRKDAATWTEVEKARVYQSNEALLNAPLFIDETSGLTITELRARVRRMVQAHGVGLVAVDYLQLLRAGGRVENRQVEVSTISAGLKGLALELKIPVLVGSQLNRSSEIDGRRPSLRDLRESGSIEQDADLVLSLFRPTEDEIERAREDRAGVYPVTAEILKHREGALGRVDLVFWAKHTRFEQAVKGKGTDV